MTRGRISAKYKVIALGLSAAALSGVGLGSVFVPMFMTKSQTAVASPVAQDITPLTQTDLQPAPSNTPSLSPEPRVVRTSVVKPDGSIIPRYVAPVAALAVTPVVEQRLAEAEAVAEVPLIVQFDVTARSLNVRKSASTDAPVMTTVVQGSCLSVSGQANSLFYAVTVQTAEGDKIPGFVHKDHITARAPQGDCFARLMPKH